MTLSRKGEGDLLMERVCGESPDTMLILQEPEGTENVVAGDKYPLHRHVPYGKNVKKNRYKGTGDWQRTERI